MKLALGAAGLLATAVVGLGVLGAVLDLSESAGACSAGVGVAGTEGAGAGGGFGSGGSGSWTATAYGPPWGGIQGNGVTATGLDLRTGGQAYVVAVDPRVIPLGSYVYVQPNPFGTSSAFYAGDTGGAIVGRYVDIYDWLGRVDQEEWGARSVTVTPAPIPTTGRLLDGVAPVPLGTPRSGGSDGPPGGSGMGSGNGEEITTSACEPVVLNGTVALTPGATAQIEADGRATAPADAPVAVRKAIAAGNLIRTLPYPEPDVHYGTLAKLWPAYDCSGATSFVLYGAGLLGTQALDSTGLERYGAPGPGRWITVYANSNHAWIVVAGIALDTADYGGASIPAGSGPRWRREPLANLADGSTYVVRHPTGL